MPDRVAMITGGTAGWDHFPFAVGSVPGADLTKEGFPVNLDLAMKWYWRIKKWHIDAYVEMESTGGGDNRVCEISGDFDLATALPAAGYTSKPKRESDLVLGQNLYNTYAEDDNNLIVYYSPVGMTKQAGDNFFFPWIIHAFNGANETVIQNTDRDLEEGGHAPDTSGDDMINCDDVTTFGYYFRGTGGPLVSGYINVTPTAFWPYADKNGRQVYDTVSGSLLVDDPLN